VLTFDDGPHPEGTAAVLELLADAKARATFFLVGEQVERRPQLAAQISAEGHEIALHCQRHRNLLRLSPRAVADDLRRALAAISDATGRMPGLYRPPYGILTAAGLAVASRLDLTPLLWSQDGRDWQRRATAESIAARVTRRVSAGDVLLLHDADYYSASGSWRQTVAALPPILEELEQRRLPAIAWAARSGTADVGRDRDPRTGRPAR
jgi:peptidoglycan-N-acetylglucosamine deacetylase